MTKKHEHTGVRLDTPLKNKLRRLTGDGKPYKNLSVLLRAGAIDILHRHTRTGAGAGK